MAGRFGVRFQACSYDVIGADGFRHRYKTPVPAAKHRAEQHAYGRQLYTLRARIERAFVSAGSSQVAWGRCRGGSGAWTELTAGVLFFGK
jgi:hypothetical protein